ncbi:MAG: tyrosine-type recombinase/integrase [Bacteroidetes bacterium]|nr:tyrosine-type recombinase/integrase [Bacteroidota bacterium]
MNRNTSSILNRVQSKLKQKKYSNNTLKCYSDWIYRFLFYYESEYLQKYGEKEVNHFLKFLEKECYMSLSTINQALNAILFLYKNVLEIPVDDFSFKIKHIKQKPVILKRDEIKKILAALSGEKWLMTGLMYGCGLSVSECIRIRLKNIDFENSVIHVDNGTYCRPTLLPKSLQVPLKNQVNKVKTIFNENILSENYIGVVVSYLDYSRELQTTIKFEDHFLFPSRNLRLDKRDGKLIQFCLSNSYLQKTIKDVLKNLSLHKNISCQSFRHSFATHLIEVGYDIHVIHELLGHKNVQSTMRYKDFAERDCTKIVSPIDNLLDNSISN